MSLSPADPDHSLHPSRHTSKPSIDTNASGLAESTISFSAFPSPPSSIPSPSIRTSTSSSIPSSATRANFNFPVRPLVPRRGQNLPARSLEPVPTPSSTPSNSLNPPRFGSAAGVRPDEHLPSSSRAPPSSYDWNDAASGISGISGIPGISLDATEDRLLSTSFITSLLQENKDLRRAQRNSTTSDALSGISEMTYPPPEDISRLRQYRGQPSRLGAPPTSFMPIPEGRPVQRKSSDSDTLHSVQGFGGQAQGSSSKQNSTEETHRDLSELQTFPTSVSGHDKGGPFDEDYDNDSIMRYKAAFEPPPYARTEPQRRPLRNNVQPSQEARQSIHSFKSIAPSFISRISVPRSVRRIFNRGRNAKPLPPVPLIPDIPLAVEAQYRRADEAAPLPDLVNRADQLHGMLEKEYYQGDGDDYNTGLKSSDSSTVQTSSQSRTTRSDSWQPLRRRDVGGFGSSTNPIYTVYGNAPTTDDKWRRCPSCLPKLTRRVWIGIGIFITAVLAAVIAIAVVFSRKSSKTQTCDPGFAGSRCNLNTTCVCTATSPCNGLAQNLIDLVPIVNQQFTSNYTVADVYTSLWLAQGISGQKGCSSQSVIVDTGKTLDETSYPNRTHWAQAALLWNVVQSQDMASTTAMQKFLQTVSWSELGSADGPTDSNAATFTKTFAGYSYNFAAQTVSQPPASFITQGQPSNSQISRVGQKSQAALDRMYTFALASSTQREVALQNYWTTTLGQRGGDLGTFKTMISQSPVYLPFNGSSSTIQSLYTSSSLLFPPPLSCYPGLSSLQLAQVQTFETSVFNLDSPTATSQFNAACFPDRPIYGILDPLRLRLPYMETRPLLPRQAAVLKADALPRAVVYVNEMLSATFPGLTARANFTQSDLDPRKFGTLDLPSHVLLQWLSSMPVNIATALVGFVLNITTHPAIPPDPSTPLYQALSTLPVLEVAVFGNVGPSDVSGTVSSFMTSAGAFFFGSNPGSAMRNWTISTANGTVIWAENSTAPRIVRDNSLADATINQAWLAVASNGPNVGLSNLTSSLQATQKFSAT